MSLRVSVQRSVDDEDSLDTEMACVDYRIWHSISAMNGVLYHVVTRLRNQISSGFVGYAFDGPCIRI